MQYYCAPWLFEYTDEMKNHKCLEVVISFFQRLFFRPRFSDRLFPRLKPWAPKSGMSPEEYIEKFRESEFMNHLGSPNPDLPAGYTYLGQFIGHDLSFDPQIFTDLKEHIWKARNLRSPALDLDSVYGGGPLANPYYYDQKVLLGRACFDLGHYCIKWEKEQKQVYDLPRKSIDQSIQIPLIPDSRNDENFVISQLHLALQLFHNRAVWEELSKLKEKLSAEDFNLLEEIEVGFMEDSDLTLIHGPSLARQDDDLKAKADDENRMNELFANLLARIAELNELLGRGDEDNEEEIKAKKLQIQGVLISLYDKIFLKVHREVKWHFQWLIIYDYLPQIAGKKMVEEVLGARLNCPLPKGHKINRKIVRRKRNPVIPLEFSVAAFRFGHSMVAREYVFRTDSKKLARKGIFEAKQPQQKPRDIYLDWSDFFFPKDIKGANSSMLIDPLLQNIMIKGLPVSYGASNVAFRNLARSVLKGIPSGQEIAKKLGEVPYCSKDLESEKPPYMFGAALDGFPNLKNGKSKICNFKDFCDNSPLWFYILMEAHLTPGVKGLHLGPVGGRIVTEVLLDVLERDKESFFNQRENWQPTYFINDKGITAYENCRDSTRKEKEQTSDQPGDWMIRLLKYAQVYCGAFIERQTYPKPPTYPKPD